jgi:hypothetical protein
VMFSANSSPRPEGPSTPSPRSTDAQKQLHSKKANTETILQLQISSCSCRDNPRMRSVVPQTRLKPHLLRIVEISTGIVTQKCTPLAAVPKPFLPLVFGSILRLIFRDSRPKLACIQAFDRSRCGILINFGTSFNRSCRCHPIPS